MKRRERLSPGGHCPWLGALYLWPCPCQKSRVALSWDLGCLRNGTASGSPRNPLVHPAHPTPLPSAPSSPPRRVGFCRACRAPAPGPRHSACLGRPSPHTDSIPQSLPPALPRRPPSSTRPRQICSARLHVAHCPAPEMGQSVMLSLHWHTSHPGPTASAGLCPLHQATHRACSTAGLCASAPSAAPALHAPPAGARAAVKRGHGAGGHHCVLVA